MVLVYGHGGDGGGSAMGSGQRSGGFDKGVLSFAYQEEMAEAIAIPLGIAQTIIETLGSWAFENIGSMWGVEDEFEKLKDTVSAVYAVLLDAEEQQDKSHRVKHWIKKLRDAIYDADDLLTEFYTEDMRQRVMGGDEMAKRIYSKYCTNNGKVAKKTWDDCLKLLTDEPNSCTIQTTEREQRNHWRIA